MQWECHDRSLGAIQRLLVCEADSPVSDVVLQIEISQGIRVNDDIQVILQLNTALLKAQIAPTL